MGIFRVNEVFVSGGVPEHTFVRREAAGLESGLAEAKHNHKITVLAGPTKSGKSVLGRRVFPPENAVWIPGNEEGASEHFWERVLEQLGAGSGYSRTETHSDADSTSGKIGARLLGVAAETGGGASHARSVAETFSSGDVVGRACSLLRQSKTPLIVDDFHLLTSDKRAKVARTAKSLVFGGVPVVFLVTPHRREEPVKALFELAGRVKIIDIPDWTADELCEIPRVGFNLLNLEVTQNTIAAFAREAMGCPNLMQEFCLQLCEDNHIPQTAREKKPIALVDAESVFFRKLANQIGSHIYRRLSEGPHTSHERRQYRIRGARTGEKIHIYATITRALALLRPDVEGEVEYSVLHEKIRTILDEMPHTVQIKQALERMSKIKAAAEDSAPALNWEADDNKIYIGDPYLLFFLPWVANSGG